MPAPKKQPVPPAPFKQSAPPAPLPETPAPLETPAALETSQALLEVHRNEWALIQKLGNFEGTSQEVARNARAPRELVTKSRKILAVWGNHPPEVLSCLGLDRLYAGAVLADRVGIGRAYAMMELLEAPGLWALTRGGYEEARMPLPYVPASLYKRWNEVYGQWASAYRSAGLGKDLSHDRFVDSVLEVVSAIEDLEGLLRGLWEGPA